jgi:hypothetical protein
MTIDDTLGFNGGPYAAVSEGVHRHCAHCEPAFLRVHRCARLVAACAFALRARAAMEGAGCGGVCHPAGRSFFFSRLPTSYLRALALLLDAASLLALCATCATFRRAQAPRAGAQAPDGASGWHTSGCIARRARHHHRAASQVTPRAPRVR